MREIKFRAWDKKNKKMINDLSGVIWGKPIIPTDWVQGVFDLEIPSNYNYLDGNGEMMMVDDCELMQYTDLKDKNGQKIYEGDIFEGQHENNGVVEFDERTAQFRCNFDSHYWDGAFFRKGKVIGNIYENPELLK